MEIRYFQIIIPALALILIIRQLVEYSKSKASMYETVLILTFWLSVVFFSIFPDFLSNFVAKVFGIKDNVNAILFFAIGLLFYFQLRLYKLIRKQDGLLTELVRKMALDNQEKEEQRKMKP